MGSIPAAGEEKLRCQNMLSLVSLAGMTLNKCAILQIGTLTGGPLCRESHPLCRLKNPTVVYVITCRLSSCKTGVYNVHLLIILERGCSSMYRKKKEKKGLCLLGNSEGKLNDHSQHDLNSADWAVKPQIKQTNIHLCSTLIP